MMRIEVTLCYAQDADVEAKFFYIEEFDYTACPSMDRLHDIITKPHRVMCEEDTETSDDAEVLIAIVTYVHSAAPPVHAAYPLAPHDYLAHKCWSVEDVNTGEDLELSDFSRDYAIYSAIERLTATPTAQDVPRA